MAKLITKEDLMKAAQDAADGVKAKLSADIAKEKAEVLAKLDSVFASSNLTEDDKNAVVAAISGIGAGAAELDSISDQNPSAPEVDPAPAPAPAPEPTPAPVDETPAP